MSEHYEYDSFNAGKELLDVLKENENISESFYRLNMASVELLTESSNSNEHIFYYHGIPISRERFYQVYNDTSNQSQAAVLSNVGVPQDIIASADVSRAMTRIVAHFKSYNTPGYPELPAFNKRSREGLVYDDGEWVRKDGSDDIQPSEGDIDPGQRGRRTQSTRVMDKINNEEMVSGEFYSEFTRIPKRNWQHWIKFFDREATETGRDRKDFKTWKKSFVLGYQMTGKAIVEIWYNSMDSSFTVHDQNGVNVGRHRSPTLNEAIKRMFSFVASVQPGDSEFFTMRNPLAASAARSVEQVMGKDILQDLIKKDEAEQKKLEAERKRKEKARADAKSADSNVKQMLGSILKGGVEKIKDFGGEDDGGKDARSFANKLKRDNTANNKKERAVYERNVAEFEKLKKQILDLKRDAVGKVNTDAGGNEDEIAEKSERLRKIKAEIEREASIFGYDIPTMGRSATVNESYADIEGRRRLDVDLESRGMDRVIDDRKVSAKNMTLAAVRQSVMADQIKVYEDETRSKGRRNILFTDVGQVLGRLFARSEVPGMMPLWNRAKKAFMGEYHRADFIMGFNLNNAVNIEIWYITEPNPNHAQGDEFQIESIASYYVYDVTAEKLIRKFIPTYRNALQTVFQKIGGFGD